MATDRRWDAVPALVERLYAEVVADARVARLEHADSPHDVYFNHLTKQAWALPVAPVGEGWLRVKSANALSPAVDALGVAQRPLGGPHPLSAAIVGGLVGGGLGYGGGALAERLLPEEHFERGRLRRSLALLGAGLGATPGLAWGGTNMQMPEDTGGGLKAWLSPFPFKKASFGDDAYGALFMPTIPRDAFNQAVWSDVVQGQNPYGTKSPWGDNSQPLGTPAPVAATVSGIVAGTAAATGQDAVSPLQVAMTAASTAGRGYMAGLLFGKTMGALAGLRPEAQDQLKQMGLWGGLLTGAVGSLFGR
jgi:hypothetical protein